MSKFRVRMLCCDEAEEEVFDTEEDAEEYARYLQYCGRVGAETLHWSNPYENEYDENTYEEIGYEIIEDED